MYIEKCKDEKDNNKDLLGFSPIANSIASYISTYKSKDTLTISIEGEWGSGKSTMMNFITNDIKVKNKDITIMKFSPWMIMEVDTLIEYFFSELLKEILHLSKKESTMNVMKTAPIANNNRCSSTSSSFIIDGRKISL